MKPTRSPRIGWSLRIGSVTGIPIRIHFTFLLLLVWFGFSSARAGESIPLSLAFLLLVFACVVLHELGHATMARRFGVRTREIVLYPIGGVARLENIPAGKAELLIALAGPAVNLFLGAALLALVVASGPPYGLEPRLADPWGLLPRLLLLNVALVVFNLLPAFPMDGGRVLRAGLSLAMSQERATELAAAVGQGMAVLFGLAGVLTSNPLLVLIALFVFIGASQEAFFHRQRALLTSGTARGVMVTRFETVSPDDPLQVAANRLLASGQASFPVRDAAGRVLGVLPRAILLDALSSAGSTGTVEDRMVREISLAAPEENLERLLHLLRARPGHPVMIVEDETLIGMVTPEVLAAYLRDPRRPQSR